MTFVPNVDILPAAQLVLWPELAATPESFTLYGGTALGLRLGHRPSVDFDFFSTSSFDPERLADEIPYLAAADRVVYGRKFNPLITLKALSFFDDVPALPKDVRAQLIHAVERIDVTALPVLTPYVKRPGDNGIKL